MTHGWISRSCLAIVFAATLGCDTADTSVVEMKMELPGTDIKVTSPTFNSINAGSFYHNGFPTDLRLQEDGRIDIDDFPRRFHILTNVYVNAIPEHTSGYHTISPIYLPFTAAIDVAALPEWEGDYATPDSPIQVIDIDPYSNEYGRRFPLKVSMTEKVDSYRPQYLLQLLPTLGINLRPNTTYAAIVTDQVPLPEGNTLQQNSQLASILDLNNDTWNLSDDVLDTYEPLRQFLNTNSIDTQSIIGATIWTTSDTAAEIKKGAEFAAQYPDTLTESATRNITNIEEFDDYCVIRGDVDVPMFQKGIAPYLLGGGDIDWDENGYPLVDHTRESEFVVTIPKTMVMPSAGFPVLSFIHGAGGTAHQVYERGENLGYGYDRTPWEFTDFPWFKNYGNGPSQVAAERGWASSGFGGHLSADHLGGKLTSLHGSFGYNLFYPVALYNSYYQTTWERVYFRRLLNNMSFDRSLCPDAMVEEGVTHFKIDPYMQVSMGQSNGHWVGSLLVAADPEPFQGIVFTGMSGTWMKLFVSDDEKRLLLSSLVINLLPGQELDEAHPFLMLMEWMLSGADPTAKVDDLLRYPDRIPPHILGFSGIYDGGSAEHVQRTHMMAVGMDLVGDDMGEGYDLTLFPHMEIAGAKQMPYPAGGNVDTDYGERTSLVTRYYNYFSPNHNGHDIMFDLVEAKHQYGCFLEDLAKGRTPIINEGYEQGGPCL